MSERTRARLALLMLACSALALIATSPIPGTMSTLEGEIVVGPAPPGDPIRDPA